MSLNNIIKKFVKNKKNWFYDEILKRPILNIMIFNMQLNGIISPSGLNYILRNVPITIVGYFFVVRITYE